MKTSEEEVQTRAYLSEESLPGAPRVQESFPHQSHELLPSQTPPGHLIRAFTIRALQPVRLPAL